MLSSAISALSARNPRRAVVGALLLPVLAGCSSEGASSPAKSPVASLRIVSGFGQAGVVGSELAAPVTIAAVNSSGAPVAGVSVSFTTGGGTANPARATTDASGQATTRWTLGTVAKDGDSLAVTIADAASGTSVAPAYVVASALAGPAAALEVTPTNVTGRIGVPFASAITVATRDRYGNRTRQAGVAVRAQLQQTTLDTLSAAAPGGTALTTQADGTASFAGLTVAGKAGTLALAFDSPGLTTASATLVMSGGVAALVKLVNAGPLLATPGQPAPPISATVTDLWGNPAAGVDVTFTLLGGAVLGQAASGADGVATLPSWAVPTLGSYTVLVAAGAAPTATVVLQVKAGAPATLKSSATNPTSGPADGIVPIALSAADASGNPVAAATIDWTLGTLTGTATTNAAGVATLNVRLPKTAGTYTLVARASPTATVTMSLKSNPLALAVIEPLSPSYDVPVGQTAQAGFVARDQFGNGIPGMTLGRALSVGFDPFVTDSTGTGYVPVTGGPVAGMSAVTVWLWPSVSASSFVYTTDTRGSLNVTMQGCAQPRGTYIDFGVRVFMANGRPAIGVPVTYTLAAGGGALFDFGTPLPSPAVRTTSAIGEARIGWQLPSTAGVAGLTIAAPAGYDAQSPSSITCTVQ